MKDTENASALFVQDAHQSIRNAKGNTFELLVHPVEPGVSGKEKGTDEFLDSSHYIDSSDGRIKELTRRALGETPNRRVGDPFRGQLFVLTSKATFSSGNWFGVIVRDNQLGKIVGEPTGNAPSSFGDVLSFTLPRSGLGFTLSYKQWIRPDPSRDPDGAHARKVVDLIVRAVARRLPRP